MLAFSNTVTIAIVFVALAVFPDLKHDWSDTEKPLAYPVQAFSVLALGSMQSFEHFAQMAALPRRFQWVDATL